MSVRSGPAQAPGNFLLLGRFYVEDALAANDTPFHYVDFALGYTRSVSFDLNTVYFGVGFNLARFLGSSSRNQRGK